MKSQGDQKIKEIEKKYAKAFSYIKEKIKKTHDGQLEVGKPERPSRFSKNASGQLEAVRRPSVGARRQSVAASISNFKVRNTTGVAQKMFADQTKELKVSLKKISVINNKLKL